MDAVIDLVDDVGILVVEVIVGANRHKTDAGRSRTVLPTQLNTLLLEEVCPTT